MRKLVSKIKNFFSPSNDCGDEHIWFEWSEEENSQYERFAVEQKDMEEMSDVYENIFLTNFAASEDIAQGQ